MLYDKESGCNLLGVIWPVRTGFVHVYEFNNIRRVDLRSTS